VHEPWAHGTVVRATRHPSYYLYNVVRVEEDPVGMSAAELASFADEALAGLEHRRIDFDVVGAGDARRGAFERLGWKALRLLWMRHEAPPGPGPDIAVEEVPYDAVEALRAAWIHEEHPRDELTAYLAESREVALGRGAQVFAVCDGGVPIAFAQLERDGAAAEIAQVYVHPEHRGRGRGTALTRAAIEAAGDIENLWIEADDEDRPKELYARLGFRPVWTTMELTLWPDA